MIFCSFLLYHVQLYAYIIAGIVYNVNFYTLIVSVVAAPSMNSCMLYLILQSPQTVLQLCCFLSARHLYLKELIGSVYKLNWLILMTIITWRVDDF